ncbi:MAG: hypothetical protein JJT95_02030 [Pararhodobacter sp.]|nr:hypothetical protein [Pararhodobacter sp.]
MKHEWMIRVIDDLAAYAGKNGMPALAEHLHEARLLAITEMANLPDEGDEENGARRGDHSGAAIRERTRS